MKYNVLQFTISDAAMRGVVCAVLKNITKNLLNGRLTFGLFTPPRNVLFLTGKTTLPVIKTVK
jgi:hypothetical protein